MPHIQTWPPTMRVDATSQKDGYGVLASGDYHDGQSTVATNETIEPIVTDKTFYPEQENDEPGPGQSRPSDSNQEEQTFSLSASNDLRDDTSFVGGATFEEPLADDKTFEPPIDDSEPGPGQSRPTDGDQEEQTFSLSASNDLRDDTSFVGGATFEAPLADDKAFEPPIDDSESGPLRPDPADDDEAAEAEIGGGEVTDILFDTVDGAALGGEVDAFIFVSAPGDASAEPEAFELFGGEIGQQTYSLETSGEDRHLGIMQSVEPEIGASDTLFDEGMENYSALDLMM
ncbi:MAG: hypothetical protein ABJJ69_15510 [Paracoccaceae bacterium]